MTSGNEFGSGMTPEVRRLMIAQGPLLTVVGEFADLGSPAGYVSSEIDIATNSVTIYWAGVLPPAAKALVEKAADTAVHLTVVAAPFSTAELEDASRRIWDAVHGLGLTHLRWNVDGSGFVMVFSTAHERDRARAAFAAYESDPADSTVPAEYREILMSVRPSVELGDEVSPPGPW
jgi:hypothetical protein